MCTTPAFLQGVLFIVEWNTRLTGKVVCRIKPGTQSGSRIRLKGKGIVSMKDASVHGDQYVTVQIDVPKNLSAAAKQKLREFEEACKGGSSRGAE